jgi:hypothetical protein
MLFDTASPNRRRLVPADLLQSLSLSLLARLLLCIPGGPKSTAELQRFRDEVANRFEGQWEHAAEYVNRWNDRFLNKARGLLTFDGLMLAALGAVYRESHRIPATLILVGSMCALAAAGILLLNHFLVSFCDLNRYEDAKEEFPSDLTQLVLRAKSIVVADVLSLLAMVCLVFSVGILVISNDLGCPSTVPPSSTVLRHSGTP